MDKAILVNEQIDAGREFAEAFNAYQAVDVIFWLNPADSQDWFLYVASDTITDTNLDLAYGEVLRLVGSGREISLDAFQIKLLNSEEALAMKAKEIRDRHPALFVTRYNGTNIGGVPVGGAYIYPRLNVTTTVR